MFSGKDVPLSSAFAHNLHPQDRNSFFKESENRLRSPRVIQLRTERMKGRSMWNLSKQRMSRARGQSFSIPWRRHQVVVKKGKLVCNSRREEFGARYWSPLRSPHPKPPAILGAQWRRRAQAAGLLWYFPNIRRDTKHKR